MHSWRVLLLPFINEKELYGRYNFAEPWNSPENRKLLDQRPAIYALHDRDKVSGSVTNYLAVVGQDTAWPTKGSVCLDDITDGVENTILVVENVGSGIHWTEPVDLNFESMSFELASSPKNGISSSYLPAAVLDASGFVRTLHADDISQDHLRAMFTVAADDDALQGSVYTIEDGRDRPLRQDSESP